MEEFDSSSPYDEIPTEEQVEALVTQVVDNVEKLGVYSDGPPVFMTHKDGRLGFVVQFTVGDVAFTKRVQNPQQDEIDSTFHKFQSDEVREKFESIKEKFRRGRSDNDPENEQE